MGIAWGLVCVRGRLGTAASLRHGSRSAFHRLTVRPVGVRDFDFRDVRQVYVWE